MDKETLKDKHPRFKSFRYKRTIADNGEFMCAQGQRTAASEAWDLLNPGGENGIERMLERAVTAEESLKTGAGFTHSQYISYVVIELFCKEKLGEYADKKGNYTLKELNTQPKNSNVLEDIYRGKNFRLI